MVTAYVIDDSLSTVAFTSSLTTGAAVNLISILWIVAGSCALVLAIDGLLTRYVPSWRGQPTALARLIPFTALMLAVAIGCVILGIYEARS
jgi:hypothetical protein